MFEFYLGKNKSDYIENILKRVHSFRHSNATFGLNLNPLKDSKFDDLAPTHNFYKQWFNLIDLVDKKWYSAADSHSNHMWKFKMLFNIMCHFMFNA
jgi:hypothetical protein